jgi:pimeloyl-ACP methyl ester carboxylesterase
MTGIAHELLGDGPPLLLLHGTPGSRVVWDPVVAALAARRRLVLVDLPGFGASPPRPDVEATPMGWAPLLGALLDDLGLDRVAVAGSSMGGWTALELAKAGRATGVLALAPAGLWERSPRSADAGVTMGRLLARAFPPGVPLALRSRAGRAAALRVQSAKPADVRPEWAITAARAAAAAPGWRQHFRAARRARFTGGAAIDVPVRVVFGDADRIARARTSQRREELPAHATVETWPGCGHFVMWDAPERVVEAALALPTG